MYYRFETSEMYSTMIVEQRAARLRIFSQGTSFREKRRKTNGADKPNGPESTPR